MVADLWAQHVGFIFMGTNALMAHAVDGNRTNGRTAGLCRQLHSVLVCRIHEALQARETRQEPVIPWGDFAWKVRTVPSVQRLGLSEHINRSNALQDEPHLRQSISRNVARTLAIGPLQD